MRLDKLKRKLISDYGTPPDLHYFDGDMSGIRTYFDHRYDNRLDEFLIDDTTWDDLSGDAVFKRINHGLSTSGEQYLYYLLRSPAIESGEYEKRAKLIAMMEDDPDLRLKLQVIFARLGRRRAANTCEAFYPSVHKSKRIWLYILVAAAFIASAASLAFTPYLAPLFVGFLIFNPIFHQSVAGRMEADLATLHYSTGMIYAAKRVKKLSVPELDKYVSPLYEAGARLKAAARIGYVPSKQTIGELADIFNAFFLLDLIIYEFLKNRLGKHHDDIFRIHEYLGLLDSAIAVASYRESLGGCAAPQIDFTASEIYYSATALTHPLIEDAVPNDITASGAILLTGSNASGKSTFLKAVALNAILAQSICTAHCERYSASVFRVYTSMAITDDLFAGESYFIAEIKSLKRIADAGDTRQPLLCVIDEVLRGTNTVERIAASNELLKFLAGKNALCLAATHDIELCALLDGYYRPLHFEETVGADGEILFDYVLKDGPATTRNAIKLLGSLGFDRELVKRADDRANRYTTDGKWV